MEINKLKENIKKQREINVELYNSIPIASHENPLNEKADVILNQWRNGSSKLKNLIRELQELELINKKIECDKEPRIFINGFKEVTKRNITCNTYERANKRMEKEILAFIN